MSNTMKVLQLNAPLELAVAEKEIPSPAKGEVLIKMAYSPINPSDLAFLTGGYGIKKAYPNVPGFEGSGEVVASGGGLYANLLKGKRVACIAPNNGDGTWAGYMIASAAQCIPLGKKVSLLQGAMSFVNPLTAVEFVKIAQKQGYKHIVFTAAASALAQMTLYLCREAGISFTGIVRKNEQKDDLLRNGAKAVFNSQEDDCLAQLRASFNRKEPVLFCDALGGGELSYKVLYSLPAKSKMLIYGRLDDAPAIIQPQELLFHEYKMEGFWLTKVAAKKSFLENMADVRKVQKMLSSGFETKIAEISAIDDFGRVLKNYSKNMSAGKVLFKLNDF